jgi:NAD(P)-dependent dehydrogenase (short-subunit alcohol dehydrogenase family)
LNDRWTEQSLPDQTGRVFLVTGANGGLGWETARALGQHGAHGPVGARNETKADDAIARIGATGPTGAEPCQVEVRRACSGVVPVQE